MKAVGIIRRIDDLGRIVIPKEIRVLNDMDYGDPIEIMSTQDGRVVLKKYVTTDLIESKLDGIVENCKGQVDKNQLLEVQGLIKQIKEVLGKEKAPTGAGTPNVGAHSNNQEQSTSDSKVCQERGSAQKEK